MRLMDCVRGKVALDTVHISGVVHQGIMNGYGDFDMHQNLLPLFQ